MSEWLKQRTFSFSPRSLLSSTLKKCSPGVFISSGIQLLVLVIFVSHTTWFLIYIEREKKSIVFSAMMDKYKVLRRPPPRFFF